MPRRRSKRKPHSTGGSVRHPNSLANLRNAPPAPAGNARSVRHGGYAAVAAERLETKVLEVLEALSVDVPVTDVRDAVALRLLAECLCRLDSVAAHIALFGAFHDDSLEPRAVLNVERQLRLEAAGHADALGLTPRSRAAMGLDVLAGVNIKRRAIENAGRRKQAEYLLGPEEAAKLVAEEEAVDGGAGRAWPGRGMTSSMTDREAQAIAQAMTLEEAERYLRERGIIDGGEEDRARGYRKLAERHNGDDEPPAER